MSESLKANLRNYLRVRGEYGLGILVGRPGMELPPRARRIPHLQASACGSPGTTSACAENTGFIEQNIRLEGTYLRVRGEYEAPVAKLLLCVWRQFGCGAAVVPVWRWCDGGGRVG